MTSVAPVFEREEQAREDHVVCLHDATWQDYERVLELRGEKSSPRVSFLEGELEIMTPSRTHESYKSKIGRLLEAWCMENDVEFSPYGSWTLQNKPAAAGAEPDECYVFGDVREPARPDLAIEVFWTSGSIRKLEIYRRLGVREVWIWRKGQITPYALGADQYEPLERSERFPTLDLPLLASFLDVEPASQAVKQYRRKLTSAG